jgi:hypothetical protein
VAGQLAEALEMERAVRRTRALRSAGCAVA